MSFEFFIARRYLKAKRKQAFISIITFLSVSGVAVGVMALVVVIAVMTGAESDFRTRILGLEPHIMIMRHDGAFDNYKKIGEKVKETESVTDISPFIYAQVMLKSASNVSGALLRGVDPRASIQIVKSLDNSDLEEKLPESQAFGLDEEGNAIPKVPGIVLGHDLARTLAVSEGDIIYIVSPKGMMSPIGHIPSMNRFRVTGEFRSGLYEYDNAFCYVHLHEAQKLFRMGDSVTAIGVWIKDIYKADQVAEQISIDVGFPYWTKDWMQMNQSLFSALKLEKTAMFIILILIVLVAAFNIASTLIMMVMEKTRDIAILKAMGASDRHIRKIFVYQGIAIGFIGTTIGLCLGYVLCVLLSQYKFINLPDIYPFSTLPVKVEAFDVTVIGLASMVICYLATLYPARQAAKLDPVEAIRYG
ncbi:MAG: lipoprotein-releasing ABC transporter permease subunit [Proteobacteria bacterium]|nr:lipoprotein-releasing ABC transporter permease subunit [Pseudomonadota bacterium]